MSRWLIPSGGDARWALVNSGLLLALAVAFVGFFQIAKHNPAFHHANPFYDDPYDAAASLATVLAALVALGRTLRDAAATDGRVARSQLTAASVIGIAVYCDLVALITHPGTWLPTRYGLLLAAVTVLVGVTCAYVGGRVVRKMRSRPTVSARSYAWLGALAAVGAAMLLIYPRSVRDGSTAGALGAIVDGDLVLLVLTRCVVLTFAPIENSTSRRYFWPWIVALGLIVGFGFSLLERSAEGGQKPIATVLYTVAWCFGITLGYGLLALPLGMYRTLAAAPNRHGGESTNTPASRE